MPKNVNMFLNETLPKNALQAINGNYLNVELNH